MKKCEKLSDLQKITIGDIQTGDIILYHGKGLTSFLIRFFDRSHVNHAGVYIGNGRVIEAVGEGIQNNKLSKSLDKKHNRYVVIKRLKNDSRDMSPVVEVAKMYKGTGNKYEFKSIFLLVIISLVGRIHRNKTTAWLVTKMLKRYFARGMKEGIKQPMICSELAFRCYNEAEDAAGEDFSFPVDTMPMIRSVYIAGCESTMADRKDFVGAALNSDESADGEPREDDSNVNAERVMTDMCRFVKDIIKKEEKINLAPDDSESGEGTRTSLKDLYETIPHFVTPRDILCSPGLESKGYIRVKDAVFDVPEK